MLVRRNSVVGANDLNVVYRPYKIDEMIGNETNRRIIKNGLDENKVLHTYLFIGDPGCGKTTAARIIAIGLNCEKNGITSDPCMECPSCKAVINQNSIDVIEINVGQSGGKDAVDSIVKDLPSAPFRARFKVVIFDEAHKLTSAAQDLLLKVIEDGYAHVYFIFCTNEPNKLKPAFLKRCNTMHFKRLKDEQIYDMIKNVCEFEGYEYNDEVIKFISEECKGIPRDALVWLNGVVNEGSWTKEAAKEVAGLAFGEDDPQIIELNRAILKGSFKTATTHFEKVKKVYPPESIRVAIAGYIMGCLKRAKTAGEARKFSAILDFMTTPIYETGKPGEHKLFNYIFKATDCINDPGFYTKS